MFFKRDEGLCEQVERLYLLDITFESGMKVVKIGKSSGKHSIDRMLQIQRDYFKKYRTTFLCRIKRDREVKKDVFKIEAELHRFFNDFRYTAKIPFDGSTELFAISVEGAIAAYEFVLEGKDLSEYEYDPTVYESKEDVDELPF